MPGTAILSSFLSSLVYLFIHAWQCWVFVAARRLSLVATSRGYCCGAWASHCGGFVGCRAQAQ